MRRVVDIEKPLHALPSAALAVIAREDGDGQEREHLQSAVELVEEDEIDERVDECPYDDIQRLPLEAAPVRVEEERAHDRDARPVRREGDDARRGDAEDLRPLRDALAPADDDEDRRPRERPHDARLIERPRRQRHEWDAEGEIVGEVGDDREDEKARYVAERIARIAAALRDEEPHYRRGQPPDDMQRADVPDRLQPREKRPRQVVHRHGGDRDDLYLVSVEKFAFLHLFLLLFKCYKQPHNIAGLIHQIFNHFITRCVSVFGIVIYVVCICL